jgi:alpha-L-fucosidase
MSYCNSRMIRSICLGVFCLAGALSAAAAARAQAPAAGANEQRDARMAWWRDARFGMFIHWGPYAVPAGEWNGKKYPGAGEWLMYDAKIPVLEYEKYPPKFNPVKFDADKWVGIAKAAGMKYIVIRSNAIRWRS